MTTVRQQVESRDFLFEIGTEELPAAAARSAAEQAGSLAAQVFSHNHIDVDTAGISTWVTPRRITIFINGLSSMQNAREIVDRGPAASKAYDADGKPTKASEGFARAKGIAVDDLEIRDHDGQQFVFAVRREEGRPTVELLPEICREILHNINFPKTMRWNSVDLRFSRPVRWLVAKFGVETIRFEAAGIECGDISHGHRFLSDHDLVIESAASYRSQLSKAKVTVDQEERRQVILEGLAMEAGKRGASFIDPAGELEEVMYLVEYPSVHAGDFAESHLRLPARVLTTCMQSHQRYFPLTAEDGSLMAGFLYVMNGDPAAAPEITAGNERVLEGRIEDAEFSFDKDLDSGIEKMAESLDKVVFHQRLGSLADKTVRLEKLVQSFAGLVPMDASDLRSASAAARLAKADQVSIMVQEFADLEGYIGSVYANLEGYPADVCKAVEEHFLPEIAGGPIPDNIPGAVLAIADRIDNIMGAFSVNEVPTGSRDPYGIRRAAAGVAEISSRYGFDFELPVYLSAAAGLYVDQAADVDQDEQVVTRATEFIMDRVQNRLVETGMPVEVAEGARAAGAGSTLRFVALANALDAFRRTPLFEDLHTAFFRSKKIADKAGEAFAEVAVDVSLFEDEAEGALFDALNTISPELEEQAASREFEEALTLAAGIRPAVDRFFDAVMVMAEVEAVRNNRLALLTKVAEMLLKLGDPMRVAAAPRSGEKDQAAGEP
ncbi:MAG: glycine--tRNA ligase subunit beta [Thermoleophilia bacterium]